MGKWDLLKTQGIYRPDIPEIGLEWARYIFRCSWANGMASISAIADDEEYMTSYVFADDSCTKDPRPLDLDDIEPRGFPDIEPEEKLVENMVLRLSQFGFSKRTIQPTPIISMKMMVRRFL